MTTGARRHRLRGNACTEAASSWLFFDTETWPAHVDGSRPIIRHTLRLGVACALRLEGGRRTREVWQRFTTPEQFWEFVWSRLDRHRPLHLMAHNLPFDFPQVNGYEMLTRHGLDKWRLVLTPSISILKGQPAGKTLVILDHLNYVKQPLATLGRWLDCPKGVMPPFNAPDEDWYDYCTQDVEILARSQLRVIEQHREHDLGNVGRTVAQCALRSYRHRLGPSIERPTAEGSRQRERGQATEKCTLIEMHDNDQALLLERASYYGGRVECAYVGEHAGPIYQLDVNSLYPSIMRDVELPCRLVGVYDNPPLDWLAQRLQLYDGCARVWLDSPNDTYPYRDYPLLSTRQKAVATEVTWERLRKHDRTTYPIGAYQTFLCGEELRQAVAQQQVWRCYRVSLYQRANLFRDYVDWWYGRRLEAMRAGDGWTAAIAKSYLNCLAGVWAKHAPQRVTSDTEIPPHPWARWTHVDTMDGLVRHFQAIGNVPQELVEQGEMYDAFPAISGCITAAARARMRRVQKTAGQGHWLYEDTDSLMVTQTGFDNLCLAGEASQTRLGALRLESEADHVVIRGVKDYELGNRRVLKGIRPEAQQRPDGAYEQWTWHGTRQALLQHGLPQVLQELRPIFMTHSYTKGVIGPDGWTRPHVYFEFPAVPDNH